MRHTASAAMAFTLDVPAWGRGHRHPSETPVLPWLTAHGWRAVSAGPKDSVPTVWQELGLLGKTRADSRATGVAPRGVVL
jgi:hypothetical protein